MDTTEYVHLGRNLNKTKISDLNNNFTLCSNPTPTEFGGKISIEFNTNWIKL